MTKGSLRKFILPLALMAAAIAPVQARADASAHAGGIARLASDTGVSSALYSFALTQPLSENVALMGGALRPGFGQQHSGDGIVRMAGNSGMSDTRDADAPRLEGVAVSLRFRFSTK